MEKIWRLYNITKNDTIVGIAHPPQTPYGNRWGKRGGCSWIVNGVYYNNPGSPLYQAVEIPIDGNVGPEFLTGSTRMKSGTSQKKLVLI